MTADQARDWVHAVRSQLALGRLLPLGGPAEGAWIAESAAADRLRPAADAVAGVRMTSVRLAVAAPETAPQPVVPPPASALPPGPVRIAARCTVALGEPLPAAAGALRAALLRSAETEGLRVEAVDIEVTDLAVDPPPARESAAPAAEGPAVSRTRIARRAADHVEVHVTASPGHTALAAAREARTTTKRETGAQTVTVLVTSTL